MDFVSLVNILDNTDLVRNCIIFKDNDLMQKTINYIGNSNFTTNINGNDFNNISQLLIINKNDNLYVYLVSYINENNLNYTEFEIENINNIGVT